MFLELVAHFAQRVLRLRDRHAVTGHDDDLFGLAHQERRILGAARLPRTLFLRHPLPPHWYRRRSRPRSR
jgi:hypothetical protein